MIRLQGWLWTNNPAHIIIPPTGESDVTFDAILESL